MDTVLQRELRDATRRVLVARLDATAMRAPAEDPQAWRALWQTSVELGWPALAVPEHHGGLGFGLTELVILTEECGRHLVSAPLVSTSMAVAVLGAGRGGAAALERVAAGGVATFATAGTDPPRFTGGRLVGTARHVPDAARADTFVVGAVDDDHRSCIVIVRADADADAHGVTVGPDAGADELRPLADVDFDVEPEGVLDGPPEMALARARVVLAGELVGVSSRALELAVAHAVTREQFGRPIGSFQGVKHPLATCWVARQKAVALVAHAADVLDDLGSPGPTNATDATVAAAMAKAAANDAALLTTRQGVQTLGALGITREHDMPWLLRRARQAAGLLGDSRAMHHLVGAARCATAAGRERP